MSNDSQIVAKAILNLRRVQAVGFGRPRLTKKLGGSPFHPRRDTLKELSARSRRAGRLPGYPG
jgi:hypothetical protein